MEANRKVCETCGASLPEDAPGGLCPKCLLKGGLESEPPTNGPISNVSAGSKVRYFGDYEILTEIARGGMGIVYKARQIKLNRMVAIKMILRGELASEKDVQRFYHEAEAAANLQHSNIVPIHEVGDHEGQHYFSMDYIDGQSLGQLIHAKPLTAEDAAQLLGTIAEAVHYANEHGVLHRDLKPSNILVDSSGHPHITDFGLAKNVASDVDLTNTGALLGTPSYMSPEQAMGKARELGPTTDVYSLGAILYEMLTAHPPFSGTSVAETILQVRSKDPVPPRRIQPKCPKDLETICLKCLQKEPKKRYATAKELADDLGRFLRGEPIVARPISGWEHGAKWIKRHPALAVLSAVLILVTTIGVTGIIWKWRTEVVLRQKLEVNRYFELIKQAHRYWEIGRPDDAEKALQECKPELRHWEWYFMKRLCHRQLLTIDNGHSLPDVLAFSSDGKKIVTAGSHDIEVMDSNTGVKIKSVDLESDESSVGISIDGKRVLLAHPSFINPDAFKIFDVDQAQTLLSVKLKDKLAFFELGEQLNLSPDGSCVAAVLDNGSVKLWTLAHGSEPLLLNANSPLMSNVCFNPKGQNLVTCHTDHTLRFWDASTGRQISIHSLPPFEEVRQVAFAPDNSHLFLIGSSGNETLLDLRTDKFVQLPSPMGLKSLSHLSFSPDQRRLAGIGADNSVVIGSFSFYAPVASYFPFSTLRGHATMIRALAFSPDGSRLASCDSGTIKIWPVRAPWSDVKEGSVGLEFVGFGLGHIAFSFSPDGDKLAVPDVYAQHGFVRIWDVHQGKQILTYRRGRNDHVDHIAFCPVGNLVASTDATSIRIWNSQDVSDQIVINAHKDSIKNISFSPDGKHLASTSDDKTIKVWEVSTGKLVVEISGFCPARIAFSPNGKQLNTIIDESLVVWDPATGRKIRGNPPGDGRYGQLTNSTAFSPDGKRYAIGEYNGTINVWDVETGRNLFLPHEHSAAIEGIAFSPDGHRLVSLSSDNTMKVWDLDSSREVLSFAITKDDVGDIGFSPDGKLLAFSSRMTVKVYDGSP